MLKEILINFFLPFLVSIITSYFASRSCSKKDNNLFDYYLYETYEKYLSQLDTFINPYLGYSTYTKDEVINCATFYENKISNLINDKQISKEKIKSFLEIKEKFHSYIEEYYKNPSKYNFKESLTNVFVKQDPPNPYFEEILQQIEKEVIDNDEYNDLIKLIKKEQSKLNKES